MLITLHHSSYLFQRNDPHPLGGPTAAPPATGGDLVKIEVQTVLDRARIVPRPRRLPRRRGGILGEEHVYSAADATFADVIVVLDRPGLGSGSGRV